MVEAVAGMYSNLSRSNFLCFYVVQTHSALMLLCFDLFLFCSGRGGGRGRFQREEGKALPRS